MIDRLKFRSLNVRGIQTMKKRDLLFHELSKYSNEIILLQETHSCAMDEKHYKNKWGPNVFFSHGETNSKGICTIIPKIFSGVSNLHFSDLEGRLLIVKTTIEETDYYVCNVYFPTSNHENDQINTLIQLNTQLVDLKGENLILGGDWNVILNDKLDKKSKSQTPCQNQKFQNQLLTTLVELELIDCWRLCNPTKKKFTCRNSQGGEKVTLSRIDMFFVTENLLNIVQSPKIEAGFKSDHDYITLTLKISNAKRGKGVWKFNNKLLLDKEYVIMTKKLIAIEIKDNDHYDDKGFLWDYIKMRVRSETMLYSGKKNKEQRIEVAKIEKDIEDLNTKYNDDTSNDNYERLMSAKRELEDLNKEKLAGSIFRAKCQWSEEGERNSKFFLNLEKYNYENKHIILYLTGGN